MSRTTNRLFTASALALCTALVAVLSSTASAASINYGNFPAPPAVFLQVTESSGTDPVPLYGPPSPFPVGLDFDPTFVASAANGSADLTDGQLNFTVQSPGLNFLNLFEAGDYTLAGIGNASTQAIAAASIRAIVTQINGLNVAPINLLQSNASVGFNLPANAGILNPWSLGVGLNVAGQLPPGQRATRVDIIIDNQLLALSQPQSVAFIAKKDFRINVDIVPEPATMVLAGLALCGLGLTAARKRS